MTGPTGMSVSPFALLWPTFAMVGVVLVVWATLLAQRVRHIRRNPPTRDELVSGEAARRYFAPVESPANNLANLFEMPVLFFALVPLLLMFRQVTSTQLMLAWFFVLLRAGHSLVHVSKGAVRTRFTLYLASTVVLAAMWIGFLVDALRASRFYEIHEGLIAQL